MQLRAQLPNTEFDRRNHLSEVRITDDNHRRISHAEWFSCEQACRLNGLSGKLLSMTQRPEGHSPADRLASIIQASISSSTPTGGTSKDGNSCRALRFAQASKSWNGFKPITFPSVSSG